MSRDSAKQFYDRRPGDAAKAFISASDAKSAIDVIYDDMDSLAVPTSPVLGASGSNEASWRSALRTARRGGKARVLCVGTSNTYGWGPSDPATMNWPALLARNVEGVTGLRCGWGLEPVTKFTVPNPGMGHTRPWFDLGSWGLAVDGYVMNVGAVEGEPGQTNGLTYTATVKDGFSFLYVDRTAGRTFQYRVDGGAPTTITTTGTNEVREQVVTVPSPGQHVLSFHAPTNGTAVIYAVGEHVSNGIEICNWGTPGVVTSMVRHNMTPPAQWYGGLFALGATNPDLTLLEIGVNDPAGSVSSFITDMTEIVEYLKDLGSSVVILESYGTNKTTFVPAARQIAEDTGVYSMSMMDVLQGDRDPWRAPGDTDHFTREAHEVIAQAMTSLVLGSFAPTLF